MDASFAGTDGMVYPENLILKKIAEHAIPPILQI